MFLIDYDDKAALSWRRKLPCIPGLSNDYFGAMCTETPSVLLTMPLIQKSSPPKVTYIFFSLPISRTKVSLRALCIVLWSTGSSSLGERIREFKYTAFYEIQRASIMCPPNLVGRLHIPAGCSIICRVTSTTYLSEFPSITVE